MIILNHIEAIIIDAIIVKTLKGKEFRKWLGLTLTGNEKVDVESERAAAEFLDSIGVLGIVWPQAQTKPDGLKNCAVFNADTVRIIKIESIGVALKGKKHVLVEKQIVYEI